MIAMACGLPNKCWSTGIVLQQPTILPIIPFSKSPRNCSVFSIPFFPTPLCRLMVNGVCFKSFLATFLHTIYVTRDHRYFTSVLPLLITSFIWVLKNKFCENKNYVLPLYMVVFDKKCAKLSWNSDFLNTLSLAPGPSQPDGGGCSPWCNLCQ